MPDLFLRCFVRVVILCWYVFDLNVGFDFLSCCALLVNFRFLAVFSSYGREGVHLLGSVWGWELGLGVPTL